MYTLIVRSYLKYSLPQEKSEQGVFLEISVTIFCKDGLFPSVQLQMVKTMTVALYLYFGEKYKERASICSVENHGPSFVNKS